MNKKTPLEIKEILLEITPLLSGLLMGITTAPISIYPLGWIALAPLWILIINYAKKSEKIMSFNLIKMPLLWGIGYHGIALFWITGIHPLTWMGVPWLSSLIITIVVWIFVTLWGTSLVIIWALLLGLINKLFDIKLPSPSTFSPTGKLPSPPTPSPTGKLPSPPTPSPTGEGKSHPTFSPTGEGKLLYLIQVIIGVTLWCSLETLWSFTPLWWPSLSYTQSPHNLIILHLAQISGPNTITAVIVAVNGLIAWAFIDVFNNFNLGDIKGKLKLNVIISAISVLIITHLIGFYLYQKPLEKGENQALKIGIIQGNIPLDIKFYPEGWGKAITNYTNGYNELVNMGVDAILTPETALPFLIENIKFGTFYENLLKKGVPVWLGAIDFKDDGITNSLFTITGKGEILSQYSKTKLVPLGEYIPFQKILGKMTKKLSPIKIQLIPGNENQILETPWGKAIVGICYESAFTQIFRYQALMGGEFILIASNNAYYLPSMSAQHYALDIIRTIETNRWAVISTNTGYSGILDAHGHTIWSSKINTYEIHKDIIYREKNNTLYVKYGDWLTILLLILSVVLLSLVMAENMKK